MARRGFFAEMQRQSRIQQRRAEQAARQAARNRKQAQAERERAAKIAERAQRDFEKASTAEKKRLEKEAREAYLAQQEAEVALKNTELQQLAEDLASILASTLGVDDYVDLASLKSVARHPPFDRPDLESELPKPVIPAPPPEPEPTVVPPPTGLSALFGKGRYQRALEEAAREHGVALERWRAEVKLAELKQRELLNAHAAADKRRQALLADERERYRKECDAREAEALEQNRRLDELIVNLGYGVPEAVHEYLSVVLANSVYPESFPVEHDFVFDAATAELTLKVSVPPPTALPEIKAYKYSKAADEIVASPMSQKEARERYAGALQQVAIRSFHEVFESDRRGLIASIALEVGTSTIDPASGLPVYIPFIIASASRDTFQTFDLSAVVPSATLERLGAAVSKNPHGLVAAERRGVRRA